MSHIARSDKSVGVERISIITLAKQAPTRLTACHWTATHTDHPTFRENAPSHRGLGGAVHKIKLYFNPRHHHKLEHVSMFMHLLTLLLRLLLDPQLLLLSIHNLLIDLRAATRLIPMCPRRSRRIEPCFSLFLVRFLFEFLDAERVGDGVRVRALVF